MEVQYTVGMQTIADLGRIARCYRTESEGNTKVYLNLFERLVMGAIED